MEPDDWDAADEWDGGYESGYAAGWADAMRTMAEKFGVDYEVASKATRS